MKFFFGVVYVAFYLFTRQETVAVEDDQICCCDYFNIDDNLVHGYYVCQNMAVSSFWKLMRSISTLKCNAIENEPFDRYVQNYIYIINCTVDFALVKNLRNIRHFEANGSRLLNLESVWRGRKVFHVRLSRNNLTEMVNFSGMQTADIVDLSDNQIEAINETRWFAHSTSSIRLDNNRIRHIHPYAFANLTELREIRLENNLIKEFAIVLDLHSVLGLFSFLDLSGNTELERITSVNISGRSHHTNLVHAYRTSLREIESPNLMNTSVLIESSFKPNGPSSQSVNITYFSSQINKSSLISHIKSVNNTHKIQQLDQKSLSGVNSFAQTLHLSSNAFQELPYLQQLDIRELHLDGNQIRQLISSAALPLRIEHINLVLNMIEFVSERFFARFEHLKVVQLDKNLLHHIDTLYFASNYLTRLGFYDNKLNIFNRLVFLNDDPNAIKNLNLNLNVNYLKRLPRFYGNISRIDSIWMVLQKNDSLATLEDHFFDNSMPFQSDMKVHIKPSHVKLNELNMIYSYTRNYSRDVFCLNERDFNANLIPRFLDLGSNSIDCRLLCHFYLQLRVQSNITIRFNNFCVGNHSLAENQLNKGKITFKKVVTGKDNEKFFFDEDMCRPFEDYTCGYSPKYLTHLKGDLDSDSNHKWLSDSVTETTKIAKLVTSESSTKTEPSVEINTTKFTKVSKPPKSGLVELVDRSILNSTFLLQTSSSEMLRSRCEINLISMAFIMLFLIFIFNP